MAEGKLPDDVLDKVRRLTIVIPTLNEEEAIGAVLDELLELGFDARQILVVDGHSTDRTVEIARGRGVRVVYQEGRGKSDALRTALDYVDTEYILVMDGDYTYDPRDILKMLRHIDGNDYVIGCRSDGRENIPLLNRFGNWAITKAFNLLFGSGLRDVCSGMYLIRADIAREIKYESGGFSLEVEIASHVASMGGRMREVDINYRRRIGRPKLGKRHGFKIMLDAVMLAWKYNPAFFIFGVGSLLLAPAIAILGWVGYEYLFLGVKRYVWAMVGLSLLSIGVVASLLAIMSIFLKRLERRIMEKLRK